MIYLISMGLDSEESFKIMENVGRELWQKENVTNGRNGSRI